MPERYSTRSVFKRFLLGALIIVLASATATSVAAWHEVNNVVSAVRGTKQIPHISDVITQADAGKPQTILLLGSDRRSRNAIDVRRGLMGKPSSDTMMLLRLDPSKTATALLSLPRDLKVQIPGHGYGKLNAAYSLGGARLTVETIQALDPRLEINHVIDVDFRGFSKAVNSLGCVFVDVDRQYYNQSDLYAKINIHAGYQRLCGQDALAYVRYRHDDNDLVRATRQQDFLRAVKAQVGAFGLLGDRDKLLHIFKAYTSSDLHSRSAILRLLKLAIFSAGHPVEEVPFHAKLGPSFVYARRSVIAKVVTKFLGVQRQSGPKASVPAKARSTHHHHHSAATGLIDGSAAMHDQALQVAAHKGHVFPVYYPTRVAAGSTPDGAPAVYTISTRNGKRYAAYRMVLRKSDLAYDVYYGLQATTFTGAPILDQAHTPRTVRGRTFELYYDGPRLRMVSWRQGRAVYWISNTLLETLTDKQMLAIAASTRHL